MSQLFLGPLRSTVGILLANDSSRQIAAGVAIGVVLGLVPKATLLAVLLGVLLCALRVNTAAGLLTATAVASLAPLTDAFTHRLGLKVLTIPSLQPTLAAFYDAPLGPWWGLQNSVTCGALLVGLYLSYPVYLVTRGVVERLRPRAVRWILKYKLGRVLLGAQLTDRMSTGFGFGQ
ncbi:MAG: TIGR03546 family protein [Planctomycetota bacterium]